jgi:hypothetical protein
MSLRTDNQIPPIKRMKEAKPNALAAPYLEEAKKITTENVIKANPQNNPLVT